MNDHPCANPQLLKSPIFDYDSMMELLMDDALLAKKVTDIFIDDIPKRIKALVLAVSDRDGKKAAQQAHSMKGAAGNMCTHRFRDIAAEIETAGNVDDLFTLSNLIPELETQFELAVQEIRNKIPMEK